MDDSPGVTTTLIPALTYTTPTVNKTEFFYYDMENNDGDLEQDGPGIVPSVVVTAGSQITVTFSFSDWSQPSYQVTDNDAGEAGAPGTYSMKKFFPRCIQD